MNWRDLVINRIKREEDSKISKGDVVVLKSGGGAKDGSGEYTDFR